MGVFARVLIILATLSGTAVWGQNPHEYFNWLSNQPEKLLSRAYRSQAEIDGDTGPKFRPNPSVQYDVSKDGAKVRIQSDKASLWYQHGVKANYPATDSGNLLFYWEAQWESGFVSEGAIGNLGTHKAFQMARGSSKLSIEPRVKYKNASPPYVGSVDVRGYGNKAAYPNGPGDSIAQTGEFLILPEVWVYHWFLLDFKNKKVSYWIGDETRGPIKILDQVDFDFTLAFGDSPFTQFWLEFNSSQEGIGKDLYAWYRNLAILKNVSGVDGVVAKRSGVEGVKRMPLAPQNLGVK